MLNEYLENKYNFSYRNRNRNRIQISFGYCIRELGNVQLLPVTYDVTNYDTILDDEIKC